MNIEKAPRWFLLWLTGGSVALLGMLGLWTLRQAYADINTLKSVAYQAKNQSESNDEAISELKTAVGQIKDAQEVFRKEYREDRKEDSAVLRQMKDEIIKAVKS